MNVGGNALDQYFNKSLTKGGAKQSGFFGLFKGGDQQQQQGGKKKVRSVSPSKKPAPKKGGDQQKQDQQGGKKKVRSVSPSKKAVSKKAVSKK